jgi:hypothetical protein
LALLATGALAVSAPPALHAAIAASAGQSPAPTDAITLSRLDDARLCRAHLSDRPSLCRNVDFSRGEALLIARVDVDRDGRRDMIVQTQSTLNCGSRGCGTQVLIGSGSGLRAAQPNVIAAGPIRACRSGRRHGLRLSEAPGAPCIVFRIESQPG